MQQKLEQLFPIFGGLTATPQQQTQTQSQNIFTAFQQPQTATADQPPPKPASFSFHSTPAAAAGGVTQSSSSVPPSSFALQLGFGQPGSGGNSGGNLTVAQGLGSDAGGTKLQFGGGNLMGGAFSAGGNPNQATSSKGGPVQNTGFSFSTGGGINLNFAAGTSTNSPIPCSFQKVVPHQIMSSEKRGGGSLIVPFQCSLQMLQKVVPYQIVSSEKRGGESRKTFTEYFCCSHTQYMCIYIYWYIVLVSYLNFI